MKLQNNSEVKREALWLEILQMKRKRNYSVRYQI